MRKILILILLLFLLVSLDACTATHSFSFTADKVDNPNIYLADSTSFVYPSKSK